MGWIDAARGLAILLVVFGHAAGGLIDARGPTSLLTLRYIFLAIYTFHMPVFFFLAGLFVERRLGDGTAVFIRKLLTTIVWAYFLWSFVQFSIIYAMGSLVNHPASNYWRTIIALPWSPVSQFWFLQALFLIHLIAILAWRLGGTRAVLATAILLKVLTLFVPSTPALSLAASNAPYYAVGMMLGWTRSSHLLASASIRVRSLVFIGAAAALWLLCSHADSIQPFTSIENSSSAGIAKIAWMPAMLPAALLGGASLLLLAEALSRAPANIARTIEFLGTMTMPIYLLHVIFVAGARIILVRLGFGDLAILPALVAAGVAGPLLVRRFTDRLRLTSLLALR
jgi:fucose 4-O-acetylase-like acetyltransferase